MAELELVLRRSAGLLDLKVNSAGFSEIAGRSRGTPRIANRLLRRVRDWALVHGIEQIDSRAASAALDMYEVDKRGLDRLDRAVLEALITKFGGGPVGLSTLAIAVGEETETVETVAEPYLVREGLLGRTPRGRIALGPGLDAPGLRGAARSIRAGPAGSSSRPTTTARKWRTGWARTLIRNGSVIVNSTPPQPFPFRLE